MHVKSFLKGVPGKANMKVIMLSDNQNQIINYSKKGFRRQRLNEVLVFNVKLNKN